MRNKNVPAQQRHPDYGKKEKMDLHDWLLSALSAACMALGVYILLYVPEAWYYTVLYGGAAIKVLFWWFIAGILVIVMWNIAKKAVSNDHNRKRQHGRNK